MHRHLWFPIVAFVVLAGLGIYHFGSHADSKVVMGMDPYEFPFSMAIKGFTTESSPPLYNSPKLAIRQGETGMLKILFTRQYPDENVSVRLSFYGIAPNFDVWEAGNVQNMSLPEGITCSINPSALELSTDTTYSANLTIVASPNARVGDYEVTVEASGIGEFFTLEIAPSSPTFGGFDLRLLLIVVGVVILLSALVVSAVVLNRRKSISKTNQPPQPKKGMSKRVIVLITTIVLLVAGIAVVSYLYLELKSLETTYHKVFDTGYITPHDHATRTQLTEKFYIDGEEWYIKWKDWQGTVASTTRLDIVVCDADSTAVVKTLSLTTSHTEDYLNTTGIFYLVINTNTPNIGPEAFSVHFEVWESNTEYTP